MGGFAACTIDKQPQTLFCLYASGNLKGNQQKMHSVCLSQCMRVCLCVFLCLPLLMSLSLSLSVCLSVSLSLSLPLSPFLPFSLSLFLPFSLSPFLPFSLSPFLCLSVSLYISARVKALRLCASLCLGTLSKRFNACCDGELSFAFQQRQFTHLVERQGYHNFSQAPKLEYASTNNARELLARGLERKQ